MLSGQHALASDSELIGLAFQVIHLNPFLIFFKNKAWSFHNRGLTCGADRYFHTRGLTCGADRFVEWSARLSVRQRVDWFTFQVIHLNPFLIFFKSRSLILPRPRSDLRC